MEEKRRNSLSDLNRLEDINLDSFFGAERLNILTTVLLAIVLTLLWMAVSSLFVGSRWYRLFFTTALLNPTLCIYILATRIKLTPYSYQFGVLKHGATGFNVVSDELSRRLVAGFDQYYKSLHWSRNLIAQKLVDLRLLRFKKTFGLKVWIPLYSDYELKKTVKQTFREVRRLQVKAQHLQEQSEKPFSEPIEASQLIIQSTTSMAPITEKQIDRTQEQNEKTFKRRTLLSSMIFSKIR